MTSLAIPEGELRMMDGNHIEVDPAFFGDDVSAADVERRWFADD